MAVIDVYAPIERMVALIRSEERRRCTELGLQPVHLQVLDYISRCNRYSDTPAALANYLGMTRGTVSQTLLLLERNGLIEKLTDIQDKRIIHLKLSPDGEEILAKARPANLFDNANAILSKNDFLSHEDSFMNALLALQKANQSQTFGLCKTCNYFTHSNSGFTCGLTKQSLSESDSEKICQEHSV
ncbi:MAG: MarR family transcriptional regulator [Methylococcales bacterium]|nr:MarR family transcriptional regulator [Methylococcales bacterium]MDD5753223.1 MarR family transcriptional regulator [Methylococcales bacterium]